MTATVNYGDNSGVQPLTLSGKSFTLSHTYSQTGSFTVTVTVNDGADTGTATFNVQVLGADLGDDFVGRDATTGELFVARSTGSSFVTTNYQGIYDPSKTWVDVFAADFNGDGLDDVIAPTRRAANGGWRGTRGAASFSTNGTHGAPQPHLLTSKSSTSMATTRATSWRAIPRRAIGPRASRKGRPGIPRRLAIGTLPKRGSMPNSATTTRTAGSTFSAGWPTRGSSSSRSIERMLKSPAMPN